MNKDINIINQIINIGIKTALNEKNEEYYFDYYKLTNILYLLDDYSVSNYNVKIINNPVKFVIGDLPYYSVLDYIFKKYEYNSITDIMNVNEEKLSDYEKNVIRHIYDLYGKLSRQ